MVVNTIMGWFLSFQPFKKSTNVIYLETNDFLLLFLSVRYLETIQLLLNPFIFIKTDKKISIKDKKINLIQDFKIDETEDNRTITFSNKYGIKKIIIPSEMIKN